MSRDTPPAAPEQKAQRQQNRAADPAASAWVSAHAGSGKTHLLANRVIRLLLTGTDPARILCLTYTRAAAAEMKARIFDRLASWIDKGDDELITDIHETLGVRLKRDELVLARRLFARTLETPGGLKVQTIHAFCERLLQAFPVEAGVPPGFEVLDEAAAAELLAAARAGVLAANDRRLAAAIGEIAAHRGERDFDDLLHKLLAQAHLLRPLLHEDRRRVAQAKQELHDRQRALLAAGTEDAAAIIEHWHAGLPRDTLQEATAFLARKTTDTDKGQAATLAALLAAETPDQAFALAKRAFLTAKEQAKADRSVLTPNAAKERPDVAAALFALRDATHAALQRQRAARLRDLNAALIDVGVAVLERYERAKAASGHYDYDDLIARTLALLEVEDNPVAPWVLYRLDGGIDHLLIDEAQDTSPRQWEIIRRLTEEFTAGAGARPEVERTVFAVGDFKQSIYSFQGAAPAEFARMQAYFEQRVTAAEQEFRAVPLDVSFRTAPQVLTIIDRVLTQDDMTLGIDGRIPPHVAARRAARGSVELWPPEKALAGGEALDKWAAPGSLEEAYHPRLRLAARLAATIRRWLDAGEPITVKDGHGERTRAIEPGDILILVRTRTTLMDAIISALKQRDIPVAGADRLKVGEHIAVRDLISLGRFLLNTEDDLALACVLKSPLLRRDDGAWFDDDDLIRLRATRGGRRAALWAQLRHHPPARRAVATLERWRDEALALPPAAFFTRLLGRDGMRRAFIGRLGREAKEPLEAFLDLARRHERDGDAALLSFLEGLEASGTELKRDMEAPRGEVRVMTVHGAKGLEAPVVFLADTTSRPDKRHLEFHVHGDGRDAGVPLWLPSGLRHEQGDDLIARALAEQMREYNRQLYVAMTRARDRLIVCGALDKRREEAPNGSWYARFARQLAHDELNTGDIWRYPPTADSATAAHGAQAAAPSSLPRWAGRRPAHPDTARDWAAPSRLGRGMPMPAVLSPLAGGGADPFRHGDLIHRLLQFLPDLPAAARQRKAIDWLTRFHAMPSDEAKALWEEVHGVMNHPDFAPLFGPGSRAEVSIAARIIDATGRERLISGQIDRLVVLEEARQVLIVDYKSNRPPPADIAGVAEEYIAQLAAYAAAAQPLWPGHAIRGALLWTALPRLMELPEELLRRFRPATTRIVEE